MQANSTLRPEEIQAIVEGAHANPFNALGPHVVDGLGVSIRAFLPQARTAAVVLADSGQRYEMARLHPAGLYEAQLLGQDRPPDYYFQIRLVDGRSRRLLDPYAFPSTLGDFDEYLMAEGTDVRMYEKLGAHAISVNGRKGVRFAVWAPNAQRVSVIGDFNNWDPRRHPMRFLHNSGIWELFLPGLKAGAVYKYEIRTGYRDYAVAKADPVGFYGELRPGTASIVWDHSRYHWRDRKWMSGRAQRQAFDRPLNIYEVHLGSWRRTAEGDWLNYTELAKILIPYVLQMGYTHIELLPVLEHPYDASWGYQVTGYFAPTSRHGTPDQFKAFVDACHQAGIGVILDWVPAHFPRDQHGLSFFDGTHLYEHADPRQGAHPDWGTLIFNFGRHEVRQFLINNALFWLDKYHLDGLRVDAVASMLYLDFSRREGEWLPNRLGGRENLEAIAFLRLFNQAVQALYPAALTIAEESSAWPGVTRPVAEGGLGFSLKWNMGWMHDTLRYMGHDPLFRSHHHGSLTFSLVYAFSEKYLLPFSHDEVVHLKRSLLGKMPGEVGHQFANMRCLLAYQIAHPGKKMLFMGGEFGQWQEWSEARQLDWRLLDESPLHRGLHTYAKALNKLYLDEPALFEDDFSWQGFRWLDVHEAERSILAFARLAPAAGRLLAAVFNFTPVRREGYRLALPQAGRYVELLNSDRADFGGGGEANTGPLEAVATDVPNLPYAIEVTLPPLSALFFGRAG
ncbi:MAG: 1,4-alpha-glucan branching protein GlgB [Candidatus Promineifilaceae bacterium]